MKIRHLAAAALIAVAAAAPAGAQFTAVVAPPKQAQQKQAAQVAAAQQQAATADSTRRTQLTEMRAWVDSAAQVATGHAPVAQDTTVATTTTTTTTTTAATSGGSVAMPATASPLPLLLASGVLLVLAGLALFEVPRRVVARSRGRRGR